MDLWELGAETFWKLRVAVLQGLGSWVCFSGPKTFRYNGRDVVQSALRAANNDFRECTSPQAAVAN